MAKETGLGWTTLSVDNDASSLQDIKNDVTNFDFSIPYNLQDVTGVDKYALERLALLADFTGTLNGVFNPSANRAHDVFSGNLRVARTLTLVISAQTLSNEVLFGGYNMTRAADGAFTWAAPFSLSDGTVPAWS